MLCELPQRGEPEVRKLFFFFFFPPESLVSSCGIGGLLGLDLSALDTLGGFNGNIMISVQIYLGRVLQINGSEG